MARVNFPSNKNFWPEFCMFEIMTRKILIYFSQFYFFVNEKDHERLMIFFFLYIEFIMSIHDSTGNLWKDYFQYDILYELCLTIDGYHWKYHDYLSKFNVPLVVKSLTERTSSQWERGLLLEVG